MKKKLKQITEDFSVMEKESKSQDLIERVVSRALRPPPRKKEPMDPEKRSRKLKRQRSKRSGKERKDRLRRLKEGLCSRCGKSPPVEGGRMCPGCRTRAARYFAESKNRKVTRRNYE